MKNLPWAGLGALAVLLALPATTPAMGDGQPAPTRVRRVTVVTTESPGPAPVALEGASLRRGEALRAPIAAESPALPRLAERTPEDLDVSVDPGPAPLIEASEFHVLQAPLAAPQMTSELRAVIRAEAACLFTLDLPVSQ